MATPYRFGAACERRWRSQHGSLASVGFVNPADSLGSNSPPMPIWRRAIRRLAGVARSMPTSAAVDVVPRRLGHSCYVTPRAGSFFGNLLDAGRISLLRPRDSAPAAASSGKRWPLWAVRVLAGRIPGGAPLCSVLS